MKKVLLILIALLFSFPAMAQEQSVYDRVMETKTLRCAYAVYPPALMKDPNTGKISGIFHDVIEEVAKLHGFTIDWSEEVGYGTVLEGLKTGRYDMFCSALWPSAPRSQHGLFTLPLYYSGVGIYVRSDDDRFNKDPRKTLNNEEYSIAIQDGDIIDTIARESFPNAQRVSTPQLAQAGEQFLLVTTCLWLSDHWPMLSLIKIQAL